MSSRSVAARIPRVAFGRAGRLGAPLGLGVAVLYMSLVVLIPLAALTAGGFEEGWSGFWEAITGDAAWAAVRLTLEVSLIVTLLNAVMGTLIAWVLVRDRFPGKGIVNSLIDLPFALPTIVAGLTLLALYGPRGPVGVNVAFTKAGIVLALLLVTLPFVVRAVQPVLLELDGEMEQAAASLGAGPFTVFRRIILPNLLPAVIGGSGLAFSRALGEFGSLVLITGNIPFQDQVASFYIYSRIESDDRQGAAAVSVFLLVLSLAALLLLSALERWTSRHAR
ncbi:sulfate ABC transporter permease subunit CysT [Miltoncostaea marina]|uniref:sulfate ABC transporter permease subunit CysT n=1 Tax=Miltoncostaea marina TaxID=2843215 RepID=UPI001C3D0938|nr:sulfate ABC transporter permease subunit CysT [Miltoncostaea marina]